MLRPFLSVNRIPAASSKATMSHSATRPRWPVPRFEHLCGGRLSPGNKVAVRAQLLVHEALAGSPRAELDEVVVFLHEWDEAEHVVQLAAAGVVRVARLVTHRAHQQVEPLVGRESPPDLDEALDIACGKLDRAQTLHEERTVLALEDKRIIVAEGDLGPDPSHEQPVVLADQPVVDIDEVLVEARQPCPVLVVGLHQAHRDLVDDLVGRVLLDRGLHRLALIGLDVLRRQCLPHETKPFADFLFVGRCTILAEQKLDHERRDAERATHPAEEVLAHDQAGKHLGGQAVEFVKLQRLVAHVVLTCLFPRSA